MTQGPRIVSDGFLAPEELRDRRVLVLGLGLSGMAVARALTASGASVFASDARKELAGDPGIIALAESGVEVETGSHRKAAKKLASVDLVVPSPGISPRAEVLSQAYAEGVPILSEVELAHRFARAPIVAVTGTNGKTTTCRLITAMLEASGLDPIVCGNIGHPFITAAIEHPSPGAFVVEVSSFQLNFCYGFHPRVSVITNIAADHLDWHGSMEGYRLAKSRIAIRQTANDWFIYPSSQPDLEELAPAGPRRVQFSPSAMQAGDSIWVDSGQALARVGSAIVTPVGPMDHLAALGLPFVEDGLAAAAAALAMKASPEAIAGVMSRFDPDLHRIRTIAKIAGIRFVDDSKATNPHATVAALRGFASVVLIAGGRNKGLDLSELALETKRLRSIVAIGEAASEIADVFFNSSVPVQRAGTMAEAVKKGFEAASSGDVVLLSPACSSYDQFANYAERGEEFSEACIALAESQGGLP